MALIFGLIVSEETPAWAMKTQLFADEESLHKYKRQV